MFNLFDIYRADAHIIVKIFTIKMKFKNPFVNQLADCCHIPNIKELKKNNTIFPHPLGVVIAKEAVIGKNCVIYQNVTIGKKNGLNVEKAPRIGNKVTIFANSCVIGDITIGDNSIIAAGSVVLKDVPENTIVAGNPSKIIRSLE